MAKKKAQPLDDHPIETFYPSEVVDIDTLKPWPTNYNEHGEAQLTGLSQSLASFGQFKNVVAWRDYIVAGHGLIEGAVGRGWKRIEIKRLPSEWSESQVEAVLIADNRLPQLSTPNAEKLADMLQRVRLDNATLLDSVGYNNDEVDAMLRGLANMGEPGQGAEGGESDVDPSLLKPGLEVAEQFGVIIICPDADEQERVYNEMVEAGYTVKVVTV